MNILVAFGATGAQGGAVLRWFARRSDDGFDLQLRGVTRNTASQASQDMQSLGVQMVQADYDNPDSLRGALSGATHVFANTDSFQHIFDALQHPEKLNHNQTPLTYARAMEERQGRNLVEAITATSSVQRVVWSSVTSPKKWSNGKYTKVAMFDGKEAIADMFRNEDSLRQKLSVLIVGFYLANAVKMPELQAPRKQADGVYELALPCSGDVPFPQVDIESDTGSWVHALLLQADPGVTLIGVSEMVTWKEWLHIWAQQNGLQARYRQATVEEFAAKIPGLTEAVAEMFTFLEEFGLAGRNPDAIYPGELRARGVKISTSSIADAMQRIDWTSIL